MKTFRLIGNNTRFALVRSFKSAGVIPAVVGVSLDGTRKTIAGECDIIWLDDFRYKPAMAPDALGRYSIHDCDRDDIVERAGTCAEAEMIAVLMNIRALLTDQATGALQEGRAVV